MSQNLFWDFDGTLASRSGGWTGTLISVLEQNGYTEIKKEDLRPFLNVGFTWHSPGTSHAEFLGATPWWEYYQRYFCGIFERFGLSTQESLRLSSEVRRTYLDLSQWSVFEDVRPMLTSLSRVGWKQHIASNHIPDLEQLVEALGIRDLFERVFTSAKIGYEKPNEKFFEHMFQATGADPQSSVMIGDSYKADVSGALLVGMKPILVRSPNSKEFRWYSPDLRGVPAILATIGSSA